MKIFISHSSSDKWAARKISEDLERLGLSTFLDEKDLRTGESIDTTIAGHLAESDHFLILLSPASVASHWVLVELGGAIALKKHLVPVLLYLGANDIPAPIQRYLARDINDLQRYYEELVKKPTRRMPTPVPSQSNARRRKRSPQIKISKLKVHDHVRLPIVRPNLDSEEESRFGWAPEMDTFLGKTAKVTEIERIDDNSLHRLDIDYGKHAWYHGWLELIPPQS